MLWDVNLVVRIYDMHVFIFFADGSCLDLREPTIIDRIATSRKTIPPQNMYECSRLGHVCVLNTHSLMLPCLSAAFSSCVQQHYSSSSTRYSAAAHFTPPPPRKDENLTKKRRSSGARPPVLLVAVASWSCNKFLSVGPWLYIDTATTTTLCPRTTR